MRNSLYDQLASAGIIPMRPEETAKHIQETRNFLETIVKAATEGKGLLMQLKDD